MYPFVRLVWNVLKYRRAPRLTVGELHVSRHVCLPWDLDLWMELNNGRTLTLYDLGRIPLAYRTGLVPVLRRKRWGLTVAGASVRYRRRIRMFDIVEMHSRLVGWDARFFYIEQSMRTVAGDCANHILYRAAVTGPGGIVPPHEAAREMGLDPEPPEAPAWVQAWSRAEAERPWPPMQD